MSATTQSTQSNTKAVHLTTTGTTTLCGVTITDQLNTTSEPEDTTCKRCLSKLAAMTKAVALSDQLHGVAAPVIEDEVPQHVQDHLDTGTRIAAMGPEFAANAPVVDADDDDDWADAPDAPTKAAIDGRVVIAQDLAAKAKALTEAAKTRTPKAKKPANVHMVDTDNARTGTLCNIPGRTSSLAHEVTCKVCLAKLNGSKPLNAISDEVKAARKAFRSFIARATYMAYMDSDQLGTSWTLTHTNLAGERYQITATGMANGLYLCNDTMAGNTKASLIETIEALGWSCGEE